MQKISHKNDNKFTTTEQLFRYYSLQTKNKPPSYQLQIVEGKPRCYQKLRSLIDSVVEGGDR